MNWMKRKVKRRIANKRILRSLEIGGAIIYVCYSKCALIFDFFKQTNKRNKFTLVFPFIILSSSSRRI